MLHIINKSPLDRPSLDSCLNTAQGGAILLIEDGVYAATRGTAAAGRLSSAAGFDVYALKPDVEARGMADRVAEGITLVDYAGFVDLVAQHETSHSWL